MDSNYPLNRTPYCPPVREDCPPSPSNQYHQRQSQLILNEPDSEPPVKDDPRRRPPRPPPTQCLPPPPPCYDPCQYEYGMMSMTRQSPPPQFYDTYQQNNYTNFTAPNGRPRAPMGQAPIIQMQCQPFCYQTCPEDNCQSVKLVRKLCKVPTCRVKKKRKPQMTWQPCGCDPCGCPRPKKCRPRLRRVCYMVQDDPCQCMPPSQDFYILVDDPGSQNQNCQPCCLPMQPQQQFQPQQNYQPQFQPCPPQNCRPRVQCSPDAIPFANNSRRSEEGNCGTRAGRVIDCRDMRQEEGSEVNSCCDVLDKKRESCTSLSPNKKSCNNWQQLC